MQIIVSMNIILCINLLSGVRRPENLDMFTLLWRYGLISFLMIPHNNHAM
jgi:hypothetical protein